MAAETAVLNYFDKLINKYTKVVFVNDRGDRVESFIREDFAFQNTARFQSAFDQEKLQKLGGIGTAAGGVINALTGSRLNQINTTSAALTIATWQGTDKPTFNLQLLFVAYKKGYDVLENVKTLLKGVYPDGLMEYSAGLVWNAPLSYTPRGLAGADGTWSVAIGQWFYAPFQIFTGVNPRISKHVVADGKPLYAEVMVSFEPYRILTSKEFFEYFKIPPVNAQGQVQAQTVTESDIKQRLIGSYTQPPKKG